MRCAVGAEYQPPTQPTRAVFRTCEDGEAGAAMSPTPRVVMKALRSMAIYLATVLARFSLDLLVRLREHRWGDGELERSCRLTGAIHPARLSRRPHPGLQT